MLKKLLKYDLKSVFKYWWIAAVSSLALAFAGGWCITVFETERELPAVITILASIMIFLVIMGFSALGIIATILIFVRFYKSFFSDEGYLTFTLPVKRSQLLNSKLLMSGITWIATGAVMVLDIIVMLVVGFNDEIFTLKFWNGFVEIIGKVFNSLDYYSIIYIFEAIAFIMLSILFSDLFLYCCITFASIITKKAKVITAIGIYYVASGVISTVVMLFFMFGFGSIVRHFDALPEASIKPVLALVLLGIIFLIAVVCAIGYTLQYWMIDRKLNLS